MSEPISLRAYAKHRGCSLRAVQKAIESGRIAAAAVRDAATGKLNGIDRALADELWSRNTDPVEAAKNGTNPSEARGVSMSHPSVGAGEARDGAAERDLGLSIPAATSAAAGEFTLEAAKPTAGSDYLEHRAKREKFLAEQAELEYLEKVGNLVAADDVDRTQQEIWRRVRDSVFSMFDRADGMLANVPQAAQIRVRLRADLRLTFDELSKSLALEASAGLEERAPALQ